MLNLLNLRRCVLHSLSLTEAGCGIEGHRVCPGGVRLCSALSPRDLFYELVLVTFCYDKIADLWKRIDVYEEE